MVYVYGHTHSADVHKQGAALGGRAKTRHQLSTLLTDAYQNREALEEKIAMARRNRKEAGNKYGELEPKMHNIFITYASLGF